MTSDEDETFNFLTDDTTTANNNINFRYRTLAAGSNMTFTQSDEVITLNANVG